MFAWFVKGMIIIYGLIILLQYIAQVMTQQQFHDGVLILFLVFMIYALFRLQFFRFFGSALSFLLKILILPVMWAFRGLEVFLRLGHHQQSARYMSRFERFTIMNRFNKGFLVDGKRKRLTEKISYQSAVIVGGVGTGKSSTFAIPNLLTLDHCSTVVLDVSGELYQQTSGALKKKGFKIKTLNLMDVRAGESYNPLVNANTYTEIQQVAHLLIDSASQNENDSFWNDGAKKLLRIYIQTLKNKGDPRYINLANLKYLVNQFDAHLVHRGSEASRIDQFILDNTVDDISTYHDYLGFTNGNDKTMLSFISTADNALGAIGNPDLAQLTASHTINFQKLRKEKTALYVMVRQQDLKFYSFLLNLFFTDLFNNLLSTLDNRQLPVYVLLDEFGQMNLPNFPVYAATARKYRVAFSIFLQSLSQLETQYDRKGAETILDAIQTEMYFGGMGIDTAKTLERRLGKVRIPMQQGGATLYREENLLNESRIIQMDDDQILFFYSNKPPLKLKVKPFYKQSRFVRASKIPAVPLPEMSQEASLEYVPLLTRDSAPGSGEEKKVEIILPRGV